MLARRVLVAAALGAAVLLGLAFAGGLTTPRREPVPVIDLDLDRSLGAGGSTTSSTGAPAVTSPPQPPASRPAPPVTSPPATPAPAPPTVATAPPPVPAPPAVTQPAPDGGEDDDDADGDRDGGDEED